MTNKDDEILDLVNENDEVIGEVLKIKANQDPRLLHREIAIILFDKDNRILFQERSKIKTVNPGKWAITCAGHVTKGMTIEEAAHMELKEELGIDTKLIFIEKTLYKGENETHFTYWFIGKYIGGEIKLEVEEVESARFLTKKEFDDLIKSGVPYTNGLIDWANRFWSGDFNDLIKTL